PAKGTQQRWRRRISSGDADAVGWPARTTGNGGEAYPSAGDTRREKTVPQLCIATPSEIRCIVWDMKRTTYIKSVAGSTLHMTDGSAWEVLVPLNPQSSPALDTKVETEDLGPEKTVTIIYSGQ